ncbi:DNA polymerase III subunit gamma/tau [Tunturibacter empetritectus]|uniref:DNA polymerase III subunit gamma/tau n=1 Tax=Tunturiibacter lichenicola TaxID=2051959 RepID=A0A7W8JA14_9BACT|nr:DNA polymerase III subunit gamma/tau [Edaphobacter lichenicola]MBB5345340.1 DNA polymerase-3 subunit gamma/tau [Edaphobacter lichenicola]
MAYQVLARKYRPQRFADVAGQDHVTVTLMNALTQGRIAHGYIFSGHRGIGKTTIARILAMALNCRNAIGSAVRPTAEPCEVCESCTEIRAGNAVDVIEIDAATNRGIDEIRELRDAARYRPARDKYKIYILDEAHQITDAAFNALLKTLEEPPDHIVFMMATTQPEDIPQTVRSRCQHFSFHAVKLVDILGELRGIAEREGVDADESALSLLAEAGDGSMRDALSIMDQAIASAPVEDGRPRLDAGQIRQLMGTVPNAVFERILEAVDGNRSAEVITVANQLLDAGNSPAQLARQFVRYLRNAVIAKIAGIGVDGAGADGVAGELLQISADEQRRAGRSAALFSEEELTRFLQVMLRTFDELGYRQEQRFHFELGLLKLVHLRRLLPIEEVLSQFPVGGGSRPGPGVATARTVSTASAPSRSPVSGAATARVLETSATVASARPAFSPFEKDQSRNRFDEKAVAAAPIAIVPVAAPVVPIAAAMSVPAAEARPAPVATRAEMVLTDDSIGDVVVKRIEAAAERPETAGSASSSDMQPTSLHSGEELQRVAVDALLVAKNQATPADALADAEWTVTENEIRVQTELSKTMLPMVINAEAEKLVKSALRDAGAGALKLVLLPGVKSADSAKKPRAAKSGSVQAKALEHPIVQRAQTLFNAEVRNVIDLRDND